MSNEISHDDPVIAESLADWARYGERPDDRKPSIEAWARAFTRKAMVLLRADMESAENMIGMDATGITSRPVTVTVDEAREEQAELDAANEISDEMARAALQEWLGISYDKNPDEYAHDLCEAKQAIKAALKAKTK